MSGMNVCLEITSGVVFLIDFESKKRKGGSRTVKRWWFYSLFFAIDTLILLCMGKWSVHLSWRNCPTSL